MSTEEVSELFAQAKHQAKAIDRCRELAGWASLYDWWRWLWGAATDLITFDEMVRPMHGYQKVPCGLRTVPLRQIVGSVGRRRDFTCDFLPRRCVNPQRWARIDRAFATGAALPVVELYQVGAVYFVVDGHHRVSVAHARGFKAIEANVSEIEVPRPLPMEQVRRQRWLVKADQASTMQQGRRSKRQSIIPSLTRRWRGRADGNSTQKERRSVNQSTV